MSSYSDVFGGSTVQPADVSYRAIALSANTTLVWPQSNEDTTNVVARINDVTPSAGSLAITMPDATQVSVGQDALFTNLGADTYSLLAADGSSITTIAAGQVVYIYLVDNSTEAGSWRVTAFGSTTSSANAAALAGSGLIALAGTLNLEHVIDTQASTYTVVAGDRANVIRWTGGAGTLDLTAAATLGNGFFFLVRNSGSGALTIDPNASETIDGDSSATINQSESCFVICDGLNWYTVGQGRSVVVTTTRLVKSVAGSSDVTLTASEASNIIQEYTGVLTGNINVIVPTSVAIYYVYNATSGAFSLTVKTAAGTGIAVTQGNRTILYCDGTNVVSAQDLSGGTVTSITAGTGLTGGTITVSGTIAIANTGVVAGTYGSSGAIPVITVNAQGQATTVSTVAPNATVTSVGLAMPDIFTVSGSPVTSSGTITVSSATQSANTFWAGPTSGAAATPTFRAAVGADLPTGTAFNHQVTVNSTTTTTTANIPNDNTIPQNTEGTEWMTVTITPTNASNKLRLTFNYNGAVAGGSFLFAIFQDSTADALYAGKLPISTTNIMSSGSIAWEFTAGTTSATTFKVRTGSNSSSTITMNGESGAAKFGGIVTSSLAVEEIKV